MRALTVCQPFADLIVSGEKRVENRVWATNYRGELLIHAGKSLEWLRGEAPTPGMPFGALVGSAVLVDCLPIEAIEDGLHDGRFPWLRKHIHTEGPFCWVLEQIQRLEMPIPMSGRQGLWTVDPEVLGKHKRAGYRHSINPSNAPA